MSAKSAKSAKNPDIYNDPTMKLYIEEIKGVLEANDRNITDAAKQLMKDEKYIFNKKGFQLLVKDLQLKSGPFSYLSSRSRSPSPRDREPVESERRRRDASGKRNRKLRTTHRRRRRHKRRTTIRK
jgi:hypothetical protein